MLLSCGNKKSGQETGSNPNSTVTMDNNDTQKSGSFTIDGKSYTGKISTQHFGSGEKPNFSVLCQFDGEGSDFALLQTTFVNEAEARGNSDIKIYDGSMLPMTDVKPGVATVVLSGFGLSLGEKEFSGTDKSGGSIKVSGNTLTISDLNLFNSEGNKKTISASLKF